MDYIDSRQDFMEIAETQNESGQVLNGIRTYVPVFGWKKIVTLG
jgi:hypothetical protein